MTDPAPGDDADAAFRQAVTQFRPDQEPFANMSVSALHQLSRAAALARDPVAVYRAELHLSHRLDSPLARITRWCAVATRATLLRDEDTGDLMAGWTLYQSEGIADFLAKATAIEFGGDVRGLDWLDAREIRERGECLGVRLAREIRDDPALVERLQRESDGGSESDWWRGGV